MATGWILKELPPSQIVDHPVNLEIYGEQAIDPEMLASLKEYGVKEPIRLTKDLMALSGHRRKLHAIAAKLKTVPVLVARHAISEPEQVIEIVESNRQREKTMEQRAREFSRLSQAVAEINRKKKESNLRRGTESPNRHGADSGKQGKNYDSSQPANRAEAAKAAGFGSVRTAERAAAVAEKIDELEGEGKSEEAAALRETLNKGKAGVAARQAGIATPKKPPSLGTVQRDGKRTIAAKPYDAQAIDDLFGKIVRAIDDMARSSNLNNCPTHKQATGHLGKAHDGFKGLWKECDAVQARKAKSA